jgi:hypothetical protein
MEERSPLEAYSPFADATQSPTSKGFADFRPGDLRRTDERVKARYIQPLRL